MLNEFIKNSKTHKIGLYIRCYYMAIKLISFIMKTYFKTGEIMNEWLMLISQYPQFFKVLLIQEKKKNKY